MKLARLSVSNFRNLLASEDALAVCRVVGSRFVTPFLGVLFDRGDRAVSDVRLESAGGVLE